MFHLAILNNLTNNIIKQENNNFLSRTNDGITIELIIFGIAILLIILLLITRKNREEQLKNEQKF